MALFDAFHSGLAGNGQGPPDVSALPGTGVPNFNYGSWGNQPPGLAGGLQQFIAARSMPPSTGMVPPRPPVATNPWDGAGGAMQPPGPPQPAGAGTSMMLPPQQGAPVGSLGNIPQNTGTLPGNTGMMNGAGTTNLASSLSPFLANKTGIMR